MCNEANMSIFNFFRTFNIKTNFKCKNHIQPIRAKVRCNQDMRRESRIRSREQQRHNVMSKKITFPHDKNILSARDIRNSDMNILTWFNVQ